MKSEKIISITEVKPNDIVLILDFKGKVRGMDRVTEINYKTGEYSYINVHGKVHQGNLAKFKEYNFLFKVDEDVFKYTDDALNWSIVSLENLFEDLYGDVVGAYLRTEIINQAVESFDKRIELVNFCNAYQDQMRYVQFKEKDELELSDRAVSVYSDFLREKVEHSTFFRN